MRLRQALAAMLKQHGVDTLFGLMGDGNMQFVTDAVADQGMRFVNARHETAAVWMADGFARASRRISAVTVTHGPGLAAAGLGLGVVQAARMPVLIIAGDVDRAAPLHVQAMNQETFAHALVHDVVSLRTARGALATLARMFERLRRGEGPVLLSMAVDVQDEEVGDELPQLAPLPATARQLADTSSIRQAADCLIRARRPILLAGRGAMGAASDLAELARACDALLATTIAARGLFHGEPRDLGVMGGLSLPELKPTFAQADLVLAFGAGLNRWTADHGRIAPHAQWVQVALAEAPQGAQVPVAFSVRGDAGDAARRLRELIECRDDRWSDGPLPLRTPALAPASSTPGTVHPQRVVQEVNEVVTPARTDVVGVGHFGGWPAIHTQVSRDGQFIAPWDFGSIGVAVPFATGAALARPDRPTIAWEGDGSLLTVLGELETLRRTGARVAVIVLDDGAYNAEVRKLRLAGRDRGLANFGRADLAGAARALGVPACTVTDEATLADALETVSRANGPVLVHVHIDPAAFQDVF